MFQLLDIDSRFILDERNHRIITHVIKLYSISSVKSVSNRCYVFRYFQLSAKLNLKKKNPQGLPR